MLDLSYLKSALRRLEESQEKLPRIYERVSELTREGEDRDFLLMFMEDVFLDIDAAVDTLRDIGVVPVRVLIELKKRFEAEADRLYEEYEKTHDISADRMAYAYELAMQAVEEVLDAFGGQNDGT